MNRFEGKHNIIKDPWLWIWSGIQVLALWFTSCEVLSNLSEPQFASLWYGNNIYHKLFPWAPHHMSCIHQDSVANGRKLSPSSLRKTWKAGVGEELVRNLREGISLTTGRGKLSRNLPSWHLKALWAFSPPCILSLLASLSQTWVSRVLEPSLSKTPM